MAVLCFDFDGTIADSLSLEEKYYLPLLPDYGITCFSSMNDVKVACRENYYDFCRNQGISSETLTELDSLYKKALKENDAIIPLFHGIPEMFDALCKKHRIYVVSLNSVLEIRRTLAHYGVTSVQAVRGWEDDRNKAAALRRVKMEFPDEDIVLISDSVGDMKEGKAAEIAKVIAVTYGWGDRAELEAAGADVLFDDISSLSAYLMTLN